MNRRQRQIARMMLRQVMKNPAAIPVRPGMPPIVEAAYIVVRRYDGVPATEAETAMSQEIAARLLAQVGDWFHGGTPGMTSGDWLMPSSITGNAGGGGLLRQAYVYVTSRADTAAIYAARRPGGVIYRVEPEAPLAVDLIDLRAAMLLRRELKAEGLGLDGCAYCAFTCPRARVLEVIQ